MILNKENKENEDKEAINKAIEKLLKRIYPYGQVLIFIAMACFFTMLTYSIKDSLSPVLLFCILLGLFIPFWKYSWARIFIGLILAFFLIWIIQSTGDALIPFAIAILAAYLSDPFITKMSKKMEGVITKISEKIPRFIIEIFKNIQHLKEKISKKISKNKIQPRVVLSEEEKEKKKKDARTQRARVATALVVSLTFVVLLITMLILVVPAIIQEIDGIIASIPEYSNILLDNTIILLEKLEISLKSVLPDSIEIDFVKDKSALTKYILEEDSLPRQLLPHYTAITGLNINGIFKALFSYLVIMPLVTFYFMVDIQNIKTGIIKLIPVRWQKSANQLTHDSSTIANNYLSGIFKLSSVLFIIFFIALLATKTKYALLLAFIRGLLNIVPFIGPFIAYLIAFCVGAATESSWLYGAIKMSIIYGAGQVLDTGILQPLIIGDKMKMSPIIVLLATIIGGAMFGFVGILVAVPTIAIISLIIKMYYEKYTKSHFYNKK